MGKSKRKKYYQYLFQTSLIILNFDFLFYKINHYSLFSVQNNRLDNFIVIF